MRGILNDGISFGLSFQGLPLLVLVVWCLLAWRWWQRKEFGLGLVLLGGGLNLIERLLFGGVRDYWKVPLLPIYNNVNDWLILIGAIVYLWQKR